MTDEYNVLLPLWHCAKEFKVPGAKSMPVRIAPERVGSPTSVRTARPGAVARASVRRHGFVKGRAVADVAAGQPPSPPSGDQSMDPPA